MAESSYDLLPITITKSIYPNVVRYFSTSEFGIPPRKKTDLKPYVSKLRKKLPKTAKVSMNSNGLMITNVVDRQPIDSETVSVLLSFEKENNWVLVDSNW